MLRDLIPDAQSHEIGAPNIMAVVAEFFGVTIEDLCGPGKTKHLAQAELAEGLARARALLGRSGAGQPTKRSA